MISSTFVTDDELHAYIDGALDATERARVAALAFCDRAMTARLQAYRTQNAGLEALFGAALLEAIPERMLRLVRGEGDETVAVAGYRLARLKPGHTPRRFALIGGRNHQPPIRAAGQMLCILLR